MGPHVRAVFFDAVGTLLFPDPPALTMYREAARREGIDIPAAAIRERFIIAFRDEDAIDRAAGWITSEDRERSRWRNIVISTLREVPDPEACFRTLYEHFAMPSAWRLSADAGRVLAGLEARGLVLGLGSNYDRRLVSVIDGFSDLAPLRARMVISSVVEVRKPAAAFFKALVATAGFDPCEVLFVGDDFENDYVGSGTAGLKAVLFDPVNRSNIKERIGRLSELIN